MFKKIFPLLRDIAIVIGGNIIYACGVAFFILPGGLITGGTTGIALFIQHLFGVPISTKYSTKNGISCYDKSV